MPYHASPKKRLRRDEKKRLANHSRISALRTLVKKLRAQPEDLTLLQKTQKAFDQAASRGVLHKRTASRCVSRLMQRSN